MLCISKEKIKLSEIALAYKDWICKYVEDSEKGKLKHFICEYNEDINWLSITFKKEQNCYDETCIQINISKNLNNHGTIQMAYIDKKPLLSKSADNELEELIIDLYNNKTIIEIDIDESEVDTEF